MALMTGTSRTGEEFEVVVDTGDYIPVSGAQFPIVPAGRALRITGRDRHGFKSAHREVARRLGWASKEATMRQVNKHGVIVVTTLWLPPVGVATGDLPTIV